MGVRRAGCEAALAGEEALSRRVQAAWALFAHTHSAGDAFPARAHACARARAPTPTHTHTHTHTHMHTHTQTQAPSDARTDTHTLTHCTHTHAHTRARAHPTLGWTRTPDPLTGRRRGAFASRMFRLCTGRRSRRRLRRARDCNQTRPAMGWRLWTSTDALRSSLRGTCNLKAV
jgi:hypothetical protein